MLPIARFKIQDRSMEPDFKSGDYIIVNKLAYLFGSPKKDDIIVFKHPKEKDMLLLKRIHSISNSNEIYVVGDNKDFSRDSRHFGPIKRRMIVGKVWIKS